MEKLGKKMKDGRTDELLTAESEGGQSVSGKCSWQQPPHVPTKLNQLTRVSLCPGFPEVLLLSFRGSVTEARHFQFVCMMVLGFVVVFENKDGLEGELRGKRLEKHCVCTVVFL